MDEELKSVQYLKEQNISYKFIDIGSFKDLNEAATKLNVKSSQVIKTLVMKGKSGKVYICLLASDQKLNLQELKTVANESDVHMASPEEILNETGFVVGAIPPFGLKNKLTTFIESTLQKEDVVVVGGGKKGTEIFVTPANLLKATEGKFVNIKL